MDCVFAWGLLCIFGCMTGHCWQQRCCLCMCVSCMSALQASFWVCSNYSYSYHILFKSVHTDTLCDNACAVVAIRCC